MKCPNCGHKLEDQGKNREYCCRVYYCSECHTYVTEELQSD